MSRSGKRLGQRGDGELLLVVEASGLRRMYRTRDDAKADVFVIESTLQSETAGIRQSIFEPMEFERQRD